MGRRMTPITTGPACWQRETSIRAHEFCVSPLMSGRVGQGRQVWASPILTGERAELWMDGSTEQLYIEPAQQNFARARLRRPPMRPSPPPLLGSPQGSKSSGWGPIRRSRGRLAARSTPTLGIPLPHPERAPCPTPLSLARLFPPWCQFSLTVLGTGRPRSEVRSAWLKIFARRAHPRAACRQEVAAYARDATLRATPPGVRFNLAPSSRRSCSWAPASPISRIESKSGHALGAQRPEPLPRCGTCCCSRWRRPHASAKLFPAAGQKPLRLLMLDVNNSQPVRQVLAWCTCRFPCRASFYQRSRRQR